MGLIKNRPAVFYGLLLLLSAALAVLTLRAFSRPHRPLEYMVAGTLLATILLLAGFLVAVKRRML